MDTKKKEATEENPWITDQPKSKNKDTGISFGASDEAEPTLDPAKKDDGLFDSGFSPAPEKKGKKNKKEKLAVPNEPKAELREEPLIVVEGATVEDGWGITKTTKIKGKKTLEPDPPKIETKVEESVPIANLSALKKDKKKKGKQTVEEPKVSEFINILD